MCDRDTIKEGPVCLLLSFAPSAFLWFFDISDGMRDILKWEETEYWPKSSKVKEKVGVEYFLFSTLLISP